MPRRLPILLLMLAGCRAEGDGHMASAPDLNQIERLSTPPEAVDDPKAGARLEPLSPQDLAGAGMAGVACGFTSGGALLLAARGGDTLIKHSGVLIHLAQSSPMGPSGGYFEERRLRISIGRTEAGAAYDQTGAAPARAMITDRTNQAQVELTGIWACRS